MGIFLTNISLSLKKSNMILTFSILEKKKKTAKQLMDSINSLIGIGFPLSKIIINDRIDVAYMMKCAGVQLAYHSACVSAVKKTFSIHVMWEICSFRKRGKASRRRRCRFFCCMDIFLLVILNLTRFQED